MEKKPPGILFFLFLTKVVLIFAQMLQTLNFVTTSWYFFNNQLTQFWWLHLQVFLKRSKQELFGYLVGIPGTHTKVAFGRTALPPENNYTYVYSNCLFQEQWQNCSLWNISSSGHLCTKFNYIQGVQRWIMHSLCPLAGFIKWSNHTAILEQV